MPHRGEPPSRLYSMPFVIKGMENGWIMSATGMDARRRKEDPLDEDGLAAFQREILRIRPCVSSILEAKPRKFRRSSGGSKFFSRPTVIVTTAYLHSIIDVDRVLSFRCATIFFRKAGLPLDISPCSRRAPSMIRSVQTGPSCIRAHDGNAEIIE